MTVLKEVVAEVRDRVAFSMRKMRKMKKREEKSWAMVAALCRHERRKFLFNKAVYC